ncbi:MAG: PfaD family polyunsaturated fatty acid/polyketide biosynthesis protein [Myxococcales bacterium]|jgi:trans-AT polyketide synthase/acyltransferase/oxidoreductase domain-containing protein
MHEYSSLPRSVPFPVVNVAPAPARSKPVSPAIVPASDLTAALRRLDQPLFAVRGDDRVELCESLGSWECLAGVVPAIGAAGLGARSFKQAHGLRYACVSGAMAGGIASVDLVAAMGKAGFLGFFGAGGMALPQIEQAILELKRRLDGGEPFGFNLLHNHYEPQVELETVEIYLRHGVRRVEAAAFMQLTPAIVLYRAKGLRLRADGRVEAPNHVFAKVSRPEVVAPFLAPAPEALLRELVAAGKLTEQEARLAATVPLAEAVSAEGDSGGHTDQRPLTVLIPLMLRERDLAMQRHGYAERGVAIHVGAAGGIGEPQAAFAAFALGAEYLVTGSINQACVEAGTSPIVKKLLCEADMADVATAPAPDMFESGARVQVLRRGTMYAQRAQRLLEAYKAYPSFEAMPPAEREKVERQVLRRPFAEVWAETERYWSQRDPAQAERARADGKLRMGLCFRWYLGMSSRWARLGEEARQADFQIWCGPAMGAFNRWARGTWLEGPANRSAPEVGLAMLRSAAALARREAAVRAGVDELPSASEVARVPDREELTRSLP